MKCFLSMVACFVATSTGWSQDRPVNDEPSSLFNPTPRELRRPLSADRPDLTESPFTVDAGAVQLELSFFDYARNGDVEQLSIAPMNVKLGLSDRADVQFVLTPYTRIRESGTRASGLGDMQVRLKYNLFGNDGYSEHGTLAIMPFVQFPTGANDLSSDHIEGGIILPYATTLSPEIGLGLMFESDFVYDPDDEHYDIEFVTTAVVGVELSEVVGVYTELIGIASTDADQQYQGIVGLGGTYSLTDDLMLDAGINLGLTGDADDLVVFAGMTIRF